MGSWIINWKQGHGYTIYRIKGKAEIGLTPNYRSLFFPLFVDPANNDPGNNDPKIKDLSSAELEVAGEVLKPGDYIHFTSALVLDAQVDCLIVLLPNTVAK